MATELQEVNWLPIHEEVVAFHMVGWELAKISEVTGLPQVRIQEVINSPTAQELLATVRANVRRRVLETIEDRLVGMGELAMMNLNETLQATHLPGTTPKRHQDKISLEVLKMVREQNGNLASLGGMNSLTPESQGRLVEALKLTRQIDSDFLDREELFKDLTRQANKQLAGVIDD